MAADKSVIVMPLNLKLPRYVLQLGSEIQEKWICKKSHADIANCESPSLSLRSTPSSLGTWQLRSPLLPSVGCGASQHPTYGICQSLSNQPVTNSPSPNSTPLLFHSFHFGTKRRMWGWVNFPCCCHTQVISMAPGKQLFQDNRRQSEVRFDTGCCHLMLRLFSISHFPSVFPLFFISLYLSRSSPSHFFHLPLSRLIGFTGVQVVCDVLIFIGTHVKNHGVSYILPPPPINNLTSP